MYENDYSWLPTFAIGFVILTVVGGALIGLISGNKARHRLLWTWFGVPLMVILVVITRAWLTDDIADSPEYVLALGIVVGAFLTVP